MVRCSRFLPALVIAFAYAILAPLSILARMGRSGWPWVLNDTAFGFFMLVVFPFAVAVFSCVVDVRLLRRSFSGLSTLTFPLVLFAMMFAVLQFGAYLDLVDAPQAGELHRIRQPYMFRDSAKMHELATLHAKGFESRDLLKASQDYRRQDETGDMRWSRTMFVIFFGCNVLNVAFSIAVFCYIVLLSVAGKIGADVCNHLVLVLAALALWFPCRAYADWFINLSDFSWIATYAAAWILVVLFVVGAFVLALRMNEGSLYHRFVIPTTVFSAVVAALAAWKAPWLRHIAIAFEGYHPIYRISFGLIVIALLFYVSNTVHQRIAS